MLPGSRPRASLAGRKRKEPRAWAAKHGVGRDGAGMPRARHPGRGPRSGHGRGVRRGPGLPRPWVLGARPRSLLLCPGRAALLRWLWALCLRAWASPSSCRARGWSEALRCEAPANPGLEDALQVLRRSWGCSAWVRGIAQHPPAAQHHGPGSSRERGEAQPGGTRDREASAGGHLAPAHLLCAPLAPGSRACASSGASLPALLSQPHGDARLQPQPALPGAPSDQGA